MLVLVGGCALTRGHSKPVAIASIGASAFVGFGTGQAIDGEWSSAWKFAVADSAFVAAYVYGFRGLACFGPEHASCDRLAYPTLWLGVLGLLGSRVWQVVH